MTLTWKDAVTTAMAATTFGLYYAMTKGIDLPVITSYRGAIIALGILGIGMCAFSGGNVAAKAGNPFIVLASILGVIALLLIVYGLFTATKVAFVWLTVTILALWAIATLRHIIS